MYLSIVLLLTSLPSLFALNNGLARTPQMGWNSWNHYHCNVSADLVMKTADAFIESGLNLYGYEYVNIDDCWAWSRSPNGTIQPEPTTFPDGMAALADYIHSKGLKFGLYSDAGHKTCAGRPGSLGYEKLDASTYASWGVDYLKYDNCWSNDSLPQERYTVMGQALINSGRSILFSMCEWGFDDPATWAPAIGNSWRTTTDINNNWHSMLSNADASNYWAPYAGPGGWNDPDMLQVGNGGLTLTEDISHFSLWCLIKAPLLIGCDVAYISNESLSILTNWEAIEVSQDPLGVQGQKVWVDEPGEIWAGPMMDGSVAVLFLNRGNDTLSSLTATWDILGFDSDTQVLIRDLWRHDNVALTTNSYTVEDLPSHGVFFGRFYPQD